MKIRIFRVLSAVVMLLSLSVGSAYADKLGGAGLVDYMAGNPRMAFDAGSVAAFSSGSGKGGTFTMRHSGQPRLKGTYTVDPKGWVDLVYDNGSQQRFTVNTIKGSKKHKIIYTKGPFQGKSFSYR